MINISSDILDHIKQHAQRAYPEECCGVLCGTDDANGKRVLEIVTLQNSKQNERERRYLISPGQYKAVESEARKKKFDIIGLYHSHPDHPARPSAFDLEHALPNWSYLIVAVEGGVPNAVSSWLLKDNRSAFDEEHIAIVEHATEYHRAQ